MKNTNKVINTAITLHSPEDQKKFAESIDDNYAVNLIQTLEKAINKGNSNEQKKLVSMLWEQLYALIDYNNCVLWNIDENKISKILLKVSEEKLFRNYVAITKYLLENINKKIVDNKLGEIEKKDALRVMGYSLFKNNIFKYSWIHSIHNIEKEITDLETNLSYNNVWEKKDYEFLKAEILSYSTATNLLKEKVIKEKIYSSPNEKIIPHIRIREIWEKEIKITEFLTLINNYFAQGAIYLYLKDKIDNQTLYDILLDLIDEWWFDRDKVFIFNNNNEWWLMTLCNKDIPVSSDKLTSLEESYKIYDRNSDK